MNRYQTKQRKVVFYLFGPHSEHNNQYVAGRVAREEHLTSSATRAAAALGKTATPGANMISHTGKPASLQKQPSETLVLRTPSMPTTRYAGGALKPRKKGELLSQCQFVLFLVFSLTVDHRYRVSSGPLLFSE